MAEYQPSATEIAETRHTLMILQKYPEANVAYFANSQAGADWTEEQLKAAGFGGKVQYVVCGAE